MIPTASGWLATKEHKDVTGRAPERTEKTVAHYRNEAARLIRMSRPETDIGDVGRLQHAAIWFGSQHGKWAPASIRVFQAALRQAVEDLVWATSVAESEIAALQGAIAMPPAPRMKRASKQTSGKKRKELKEADQKILVEWLARRPAQTARLLAGLLTYGAIFGLRPREWLRAQLKGNTLVVSCAKATNGRSVTVRFLNLVGWSAKDRNGLAVFLTSFRQAAYRAGCWQTFHERLAKALTRACVKLGVPAICLYTLRHVAIATAKRVLGAREVAAMAGHISPETARRSYAPKRTGWPPSRRSVAPDARTIAAVGPSISRPSNPLSGGLAPR